MHCMTTTSDETGRLSCDQECEFNPKKPVMCELGCELVVTKDQLKVGLFTAHACVVNVVPIRCHDSLHSTTGIELVKNRTTGFVLRT